MKKNNKRFFLSEEDMDAKKQMEELIKSAEEDLEQDRISLENFKKSIENDENNIRLKKQEIVANNKMKSMGAKAEPNSDAKIKSLTLTKDIPVLNNQVQALEKELQEKRKMVGEKEEMLKAKEERLNNLKKPDSLKQEEPAQGMANENRVIKVKDFLNLNESKVSDKLNLSESDILRILAETQNPVMTKSELIESISNKILNEARMNDDVREKFESGDNDYSGILDPEVVKNLADEAFAEVSRNIQQKTGKQNVTIQDVQQLMSNSLMSAAKKEFVYGTDRLEQKAIEMIRKKYHIPEGAVEFEATITGVPAEMLIGRSVSPQEAQQLSRQLGVKIGKVNSEGIKKERGNKEVPQGKTSEELKPKIKRRRLTNAMAHGSARKSQNLHHMDDELRTNDATLNTDYANLMAANDASYFLLDDSTIKSQGETGIHAGNSRVQLSREKGGRPKVIAQGMVFPILLHELSKGVLELMSLWSLPVDAQERQYVLDKTDNLESETNDIRLGAKLWEKFVNEIPVENQEVISLTWNYLQKLSDSEFNSIIDGLLANSTDARNKVRRMAEDAIEELETEAYEDAIGSSDDEYEDENPPVETPEVPETPEAPETPEDVALEDMSDEELRSLMMSAIDDEDYEYASQIRDILKNR